MNDDLRPSRSTWMGALALSAEQRDELLGAGGQFEMWREDVVGHEMAVFARRPRRLRDHFDEVTAANTHATFLVSGEEQWTFEEATRRVDAVAALLVGRYGIEPGDRVAIVSANSPAYAITMWATVSIGAVVTSLNGWWAGAELAYGIELTEPKLLVGDSARLGRVPGGAVPRLVPVLTLDDLLAEAIDGTAPPRRGGSEDDPAVILFTSGTTGRPKGATLSHRNLVHLAWTAKLGQAIGAAMSKGVPATRSLPASILSSPMFHISGMAAVLASGPTMGTKLVFPPMGQWDPRRHLELTVEHGITGWSGVPTQYFRILHHPDFASFDLGCLRSATSGGASFPPELVHEFSEKLPRVMLANGYGMTETTGLGTLNAGPGIVAMPDSVGPASAGMVVETRDPMGQPVPEGEVGEIYLRAPSVFLGYWQDAAATAAAIVADGWYRTGDYGRIENGFVHLESRMRDLIIRGGENIYPIEIENRLVEHPSVEDAAVVGVDHPELGQEVKAFVVVADGATLSTPEVQEWVAAGLARFKVPAHVEFVDELPYNESGKVVKARLEQPGGR
jgi:acyl-CoA synthetase (AMP-forming)/AMP-acid ligase II